MFSLNSINTQNQVLVSLNQLSSRYASLFKQRKQRGEKTNHVKRKEASYDATICQESLSECLRNFEKDVLKEMRQVDLRAVTLSRARPSALTSAKKVSFISEDSFEKNKNGWSSPPTVTVDVRRGRFNVTENFVGLLASSLRQNSFKFNVQVRGFKTERGVDADLKRNPNLINRLRKSLGQYA